MKMVAIVCGEGKTDVGERDYTSHNWNNGAAMPFIQNAAPVELELAGISENELLDFQSRIRIQRLPSHLHYHAVKSYKLAIYALENAIPVAICYVDCDKEEFEEQYKHICAAFDIFQDDVIGIAMIPKRMIESWLLADENAYKSLFGKIPDNPRLPNKPEDLKGDKHDPKSNYPKHFLSRVLHQFGLSGTAMFYDIASNSNIETLRKKCPISFEHFYQDINAKLVLQRKTED